MTQTPVRIAQFTNLLLFTLVVGVFWGTWFSLSRSIASITPQGFLEIGHTMIANLGMPMSLLLPAALLSSVVVLFGFFRQRQFGAFYLALAGLLLLLAALGITLSVNVPIDAEIDQWRIDTLPLNWTTIRDRWQFYHTIRTFLSLAGLSFAIASVIWSVDATVASER
jgi:uncharacterized membrane protein